MWPELETFLTEYRRKLDQVSADLVEIARCEIIGVYDTVADDPAALERWDEFREMIRSQVRFEAKYQRSRKLISEACGRPEVVQ